MTRDLGAGLTLTHASSGQLRYNGPPSLVPPGGDVVTNFCLHLHGATELVQRDRLAEVDAGHGVMYDHNRPWSMRFTRPGQGLILRFPRERLPLDRGDVDRALARTIAPGLGTMRMLSGYLRELDAVAAGLSESRLREAGLVALDLLTMTLRGVVDDTDSAATDATLRMMRRYVRDNLHDRDLTVATLARRHLVSVRHTHTLFAGAGSTPGGYIREQRLLAARAMLSDPRYRDATIAEIAAVGGFLEPRTFERAFRRRFGSTPGVWRRGRAQKTSVRGAESALVSIPRAGWNQR
ncbi:AraC family transcriptional regulator [Actinoplanes sp. TBRC 11911]|uniref:helix-turn-helix domain-containing protein n=1 Tax=Actinoplanes sp. TBRC 11911 TaxID=2729386 RepID=UPI00145CFFF3|nr:AraC family transcriptional regulator [Actinoplanes sp. TBRC 11911]NMO57566.1 AraC family transcriptional regulator [Actinoplanes sp. TBRC 11911]